MRRLLPLLTASIPVLFSPTLFAQSYYSVTSCDQLVDIYNEKNRPLYIDIVDNLDCTSAPTLVESLSGVINGNGHAITNLNFKSERGYKLTKANLNNITFKNTSIHNENSFDHLFDIDDHWRNVKFINIETTGAPFNQLFYSLDNKELTDVSIDLVGVKLAAIKDLLSSRISRSSINNLELLNAFVSRHSSSPLSLLSRNVSRSTLTNVTLADITVIGEPTGDNGKTSIVDKIADSRINGLTLENVTFSRSEEDAFFYYESDNKSTYTNIYHNLFDDTTNIGSIPLVSKPKDDPLNRTINFQSMNQPMQAPAMCTPYLLQDSYFGIKAE
ncbi:conserved exported hypothetical protein [Vibrio chagasii]|nr:conserved exported hypothetical protein [Vibrio chagasii]CAH7009613.1 conserved exported hypothetical protein [Vibrio chagasii]CAH7145732.1 conserved exported hypothetical protein [Vibrio chagasii]CAH7253415.1 conserved exported hypothetical protein [Vibrio chagasii]CAH7263271.1 conserved exported hypothetical protein [Vibrio chagasii]